MYKPRSFAILFAVVALGTASLATDAVAGGHFGGGHFGGGGNFGGGHFGGGGNFGDGHFGHDHFGGRFFFPSVGDNDYWGYNDGNDEDCWQNARVPTPRGWRWREVWVCG
jgi:hypothetical protein